MSSVRTLSGFISTGVHSDSDSAPTASSRGSQRPHLPLRVSRALCSSLPRDRSPTPKQARPEHASPSRRNSSPRRRNPAASRRRPRRQGGASPLRSQPADFLGPHRPRETLSPPQTSGGGTVGSSPQESLAPTRHAAGPASSARAAALASAPPRLGLAAPLQSHHPHLSASRPGRVLTQSC